MLILVVLHFLGALVFEYKFLLLGILWARKPETENSQNWFSSITLRFTCPLKFPLVFLFSWLGSHLPLTTRFTFLSHLFLCELVDLNHNSRFLLNCELESVGFCAVASDRWITLPICCWVSDLFSYSSLALSQFLLFPCDFGFVSSDRVTTMPISCWVSDLLPYSPLLLSRSVLFDCDLVLFSGFGINLLCANLPIVVPFLFLFWLASICYVFFASFDILAIFVIWAISFMLCPNSLDGIF